MKPLRAWILGILLLAMTVSVCVPANAGGVWEWQGAGNAIPIASEEDCPIVVEKAVITYDIPSFPMKELEEPNYDYSASVTAEYSLYNPTEEDITMGVWLPVWDRGEYYHDWGLRNAPEVPYSITLGEEEISYTTRHVAVIGNQPATSYESFGLVSTDFIEDEFFSPDLKVTVYTYPLGPGIVHLDADEIRYFGFEVPQVGDGTKVAFPGMSCYGTHYDYETETETTVFAVERYGMEWMNSEADLALRVCFLGEPPVEPPRPRVFLNWNEEHSYFSDEIVAEQYLGDFTVEEMTLLELADSLNIGDEGFSQVDWYNGLVSKMLWDTRENPEGILTLDRGYQSYEMEMALWEQQPLGLDFYTYDSAYLREVIDLRDQMMGCYVYSFTIGAGERLNHRIQTPLYPSIHHSFEMSTYKYINILSTAKSWGAFGNLEVVIRTPYVMENCSLNGFIQEEGGYRLTAEGLPDGELYFELEEDIWSVRMEELNEMQNQETETVKKGTLKPWILVGGLLLLAVGTALFLSLRHKKNTIG